MIIRFTDEGFVEYGLIIPHNHYAKNIYARGGRRTKHGQAMEGADIEWILKGKTSTPFSYFCVT